MRAAAVSRRTLLLAALVVLGACGEPDDVPLASPWEQPVDGAVDVTAWTDDGQPTAPFGAGGVDWSGPSEILDALAGSLAASAEMKVSSQIVRSDGNDATVGWVRLETDDAPLLAQDMRIEMRRDGGSWAVARTWSREHCAHEVVDGRCE
jgi:hypothetical protein